MFIARAVMAAALTFGTCGLAEASETWSCTYLVRAQAAILKVTADNTKMVLITPDGSWNYKVLGNDTYALIAATWQTRNQVFNQSVPNISTLILNKENGYFQ